MSAQDAGFVPGLFTKQLAAKYLSVSVRDLDEKRRKGHITAVGDGRRVMFRRKDLDKYIDELGERTS